MADTVVVTRSQNVDASAETIYGHIADLAKWEAWSPWAAMDPDMNTTYTGEAGSVGAGSHWTGNRKVGEGKMTVTGLEASRKVDVDLEFIKPFKSQNQVEFALETAGDATSVTWTMIAPNTFMTKVMAFFGKSLDKMVGPDFEKGLASLKQVAES